MADKNKDARLGGERKGNMLPPVEKKKKSGLPNVLFNIFIIAFIGYGFFVYVQKGGDAGVLSELGEKLEVIDNGSYQEGDPRIDRLQHQQRMNVLGRIFPHERPAVAHQTLQEGSGPPAACGQLATYRLIEGLGEERQVTEPRQLRLGSVSVPQGMSLGMQGMRVGEVRRLTIPEALWTAENPTEMTGGSHTMLMVELQALEPVLPQSEMPLRRFIIRGGGGAALRCGDLAVMHITLWGGDGVKLFDSKQGAPVYFFLGEGRVPYAIERGVTGMAPGGLYSLAFAPSLQAPLVPEAQDVPAPQIPFNARPFPQDIEWPEEQIVLVDIDYPEQLEEKPLPAVESPVTEPVETENQSQTTE